MPGTMLSTWHVLTNLIFTKLHEEGSGIPLTNEKSFKSLDKRHATRK